MSKLGLACGLTLSLALSSYAPFAAAVKVTRDAEPPPPAAVAPAPKAEPAPAPSLPALSAAEIVDRNVAARGGLAAWRAVRSLTMSGELDAGGKKDTMLPYTLELKRPLMQRLAVKFAGQTALQVYNGKTGWTLRPYLGRTDPEPFTPEELRKAAAQSQELDGLLIDYAAKGSKVELEGTETVEGHGDYRIKLITRDGVDHHIWIDGSTFLETKLEGLPHSIDGKMRRVDTFLRDYRSVDGLMIPFVSETVVEGVRDSRKMTVDKVAINPKIDNVDFGKPQSLPHRPGSAISGAFPAPVQASPAAPAGHS